METIRQVAFAVEERGSTGPTGRFFEVAEVAVADHGGNEYGRATTVMGLARVRRRVCVPHRVKAVRVVGLPQDNLLGEVLCDF